MERSVIKKSVIDIKLLKGKHHAVIVEVYWCLVYLINNNTPSASNSR